MEATQMEATRVTLDEVKQRMDRGETFTFLDTRNPKAWSEAKTKLPGAIRVPADEVEKHLEEIPRDRTVITYCCCPHEESSADVAQGRWPRVALSDGREIGGRMLGLIGFGSIGRLTARLSVPFRKFVAKICGSFRRSPRCSSSK